MIKPQALIFDLDGVLANTIDLHNAAWKSLADAEGVPFSAADMDRTRGWHRREIMVKLLAPRPLSTADFDRLSKHKDDLYQTALYRQNPESLLLPGALDLIHAARRNHLKVGVASSSTSARQVLRQAAILDQLDAVADGHTVRRSKPAPDVFIWVAGALGIPPANAIAFEDAEAGVQAALTAGMFVVGVGHLELVEAAHLHYSGLDSVDLDEILLQFDAFHNDSQPVRV